MIVGVEEPFSADAPVSDARASGVLERAADEHYRLVFDQAPIGMAIVALDGRFERVNDALCAIVGYSRDELTGLTFQAITHPDDLGTDLALAERLTRGDVASYHLAKRYVRKDGEVVDVDLTGSIVRDASGRALHYVAHVVDATERRRAERALERSEESLVRAQRAARVGSFDWDLRTGAVSRSAELCALYGYPPDAAALPPWSLETAIHPDDRALVRRTLEDALARGVPYQVEHRVVLRDGEERVVVHKGDVVQEGGKSVRVVGTMLDITERKRAERERERVLGYLRAVFDQCPVGIVIARAEGEGRVEMNARAAEWLARSGGRLGDPPDLVRAADGAAIPPSEFPLVRAFRGERVESTEYQLRRPDETVLPITASSAPVLDGDGERIGAVVVFQDLTPVKQLERLRAEWSSIVAHDLRQPLNAIALHARVALRGLRAATGIEPAVQAVETVERAAKRLDRMIDDLLDLSRLDAHRMELAPRPTDLRTLVGAAADAVAMTAADRPLRVCIDPATPTVEVDPDRIAQVLENLLSNAVKYGAPGTPISVDVTRGEGSVVVAVTNEGAGIAPEDVPRLFERFVRAEHPRGGSPVKGIGLGLHIVRALVRAHGGEVGVETEPGKRTTFRFTLPDHRLA